MGSIARKICEYACHNLSFIIIICLESSIEILFCLGAVSLTFVDKKVSDAIIEDQIIHRLIDIFDHLQPIPTLVFIVKINFATHYSF